MKNKPSILFWGTPGFALPVLETLQNQNFAMAGVVTRPDEPVGREQIITPPPAKVFAQARNIPIFQPESLKTMARQDLPPADLYIVAAYGKIIPKQILEIPKFCALVLHPSLLPRWRGPSPVQFSILNGDEVAGVTIMKMDELMDHGPIVAQRVVCDIDRKSFTELNPILWEAGTKLLMETLPKWIDGEITGIEQDDASATFSKMLKRDDGRIDWKKPASEIERMIRAFNPWPGTWTLLPTKDKIMRVKIEKGDAEDEEILEGSPGYLRIVDDRPLIKTGRGSIALKEVTLEGKKTLDAPSFLRGYSHLIGTTFI